MWYKEISNENGSMASLFAYALLMVNAYIEYSLGTVGILPMILIAIVLLIQFISIMVIYRDGIPIEGTNLIASSDGRIEWIITIGIIISFNISVGVSTRPMVLLMLPVIAIVISTTLNKKLINTYIIGTLPVLIVKTNKMQKLGLLGGKSERFFLSFVFIVCLAGLFF